MQILRPSEMGPIAGQLVCRESRFVGTVRNAVFVALLIAVVPFWWHVSHSWFFLIVCIALAVVVCPDLLGGIGPLYRKSNWILISDDKGVWLNLRSYLNDHLPEGPTVVRLDWDEIKSVSLYREKYTTPGGGRAGAGSTTWRSKYLQLRLAHTDMQGLVEALHQERNQEPVPLRLLGGLVKISGKTLDVPVSAPERDTIRIAWRGTRWVTPSANKVIELLAARTRVGPEVFDQRADWQELDDAEVDSLVMQLALSGNTIEATQLLWRRKGLTYTEASLRVDEIIAQQ